MRPPSALRFALALAALLAPAALGIAVGCGPDTTVLWICDNPINGKADLTVYDANHYVGGVFDPCHCYDPCGESKECPILVDAGPPPPDAMCEAGDGGG